MRQSDQTENIKSPENKEMTPEKNRKLSAGETEQVSGGSLQFLDQDQNVNTPGGNQNYF